VGELGWWVRWGREKHTVTGRKLFVKKSALKAYKDIPRVALRGSG
jgi:hypothetical protein